MRTPVEESIPNDITKILDKNKKAYRTLVSLLKSYQNFQTKRAVSDIIASLLLVAITVVVGIIMYGIVKDTGIAESVTAGVSQPITFEGGIKLSAYDARDGADLMGITNIDNSATTDGKLKTNEFIVLKITNNSPNSIFLNAVTINDISHTFDTSLPPASSGKFSIIPGTAAQGTTPQSTSEIEGGRSVKVVVKLGSMDDINLRSAIRIGIDATGFDLQNFIITAGNAR